MMKQLKMVTSLVAHRRHLAPRSHNRNAQQLLGISVYLNLLYSPDPLIPCRPVSTIASL
jgi:hypothetical protein